MRVLILLGLLSLLGCDSSRRNAPGTEGQAQAGLSAATDASKAGPGAPLEWTAPTPIVERGRCWARLKPLPREARRSARELFENSNPGWEVAPGGIDSYTGLVRSALHSRQRSPVGEAIRLSQDEFKRRLTEPLKRNAALLGLRPVDVQSIQWDTPTNLLAKSTLKGATAVGKIACQSEAVGRVLGDYICWMVRVMFARDGVVVGFVVRRRGPPVEVCATPAITAEEAQSAPGIFDAPKRTTDFAGMQRDFTVSVEEVGKASLSFHMDITRQDQVWRLVWLVPVRDGARYFFVDAVSGEVIGGINNVKT